MIQALLGTVAPALFHGDEFMVVSITYPANRSQWYAKGRFADGTYFEMPAVFAPDGSCDMAATDEKVAQLEMVLEARKLRESGQ